MKKILIIDDSHDHLMLQRMLLELEGYEVIVSASADEALRLLEKNAQPDLILLDVSMPNMSGTEFLKWIRENRPEFSRIPVVFTTAFEESPAEAQDVGFINKMVSADEFIEKIHEYL